MFEIDITTCPDCGDDMRLISVITSPPVIRKILDHVGLPSEPPKIEARGPPEDQLELLWEDDHVA